jgi:hypothetical protein
MPESFAIKLAGTADDPLALGELLNPLLHDLWRGMMMRSAPTAFTRPLDVVGVLL